MRARLDHARGHGFLGQVRTVLRGHVHGQVGDGRGSFFPPVLLAPRILMRSEYPQNLNFSYWDFIHPFVITHTPDRIDTLGLAALIMSISVVFLHGF
jgi:hypothetical protein